MEEVSHRRHVEVAAPLWTRLCELDPALPAELLRPTSWCIWWPSPGCDCGQCPCTCLGACAASHAARIRCATHMDVVKRLIQLPMSQHQLALTNHQREMPDTTNGL